MTRRELREQIFKLLFGVEFHDRQELPEQIAVYEETEEPWDTKDGAYISGKCEDIVAHLAEIDEAIDAVAEGWKTGRMGKVDLTLIRLAVYEMKYDEDVPVGVAINEAVEEAKAQGIHGKATTPFLLAKIKDITGGSSLDANIQLVYNNAKLAAATACELAKLAK